MIYVYDSLHSNLLIWIIWNNNRFVVTGWLSDVHATGWPHPTSHCIDTSSKRDIFIGFALNLTLMLDKSADSMHTKLELAIHDTKESQAAI